MGVMHKALGGLLRLQSALSFPIGGLFFRPIQEESSEFIQGQCALCGQRLYLSRADHTSCEVIAVANASRYLNRPYSFKTVKRAFLLCGGLTLWLVGFFGGNPFSIGRVLKRLGIASERMTTLNLAHDGGYIISFWNGAKKLSLHTVFVEARCGKTRAYNLYGGDKSPRAFDPEKYKELFIRGFYVGSP